MSTWYKASEISKYYMIVHIDSGTNVASPLTKHTQSCKKKFKSESASTQSTQSTSSEDNSLVI